MGLNQEAVKFSNLAATSAAFNIELGGVYRLVAAGTFSSTPTVTVSVLASDGSTYVPTDLTLTAAGSIAGYLPPGSYNITLGGGATAIYATLARCSVE